MGTGGTNTSAAACRPAGRNLYWRGSLWDWQCTLPAVRRAAHEDKNHPKQQQFCYVYFNKMHLYIVLTSSLLLFVFLLFSMVIGVFSWHTVVLVWLGFGHFWCRLEINAGPGIWKGARATRTMMRLCKSWPKRRRNVSGWSLKKPVFLHHWLSGLSRSWWKARGVKESFKRSRMNQFH